MDESAIVESEEVQPGVILDFNAEGKVLGIEIFALRKRANAEQFRVFRPETV